MTTQLPMNVRMLVADAQSQAKRYGHGDVTPLHLVAALSARGLAKEQLTESITAAVANTLKAIQPNYAAPTPNAETMALLDQVAGASDPMAALIDSLVDIAQKTAQQTPAPPPAATPTQSDGPAAPPASPDATPAAAARPVPPNELNPAQREMVALVPTELPGVTRPALLHRILSMLTARQPQSVLLVGDPGSGRSTVAQLLAAKLADLDPGEPIAGLAVYRSSIAGLIQRHNLAALSPLARQAVLFLDDIDVALRLGSAPDLETLAAVRALLAQPGSRVVLVISSANLERLRTLDPELFTQVELCRVSDLEAQDILQIADTQAAELAAHHQVSIPTEVLAAAVLPRRLADTRSHPALAIRRLDRAAAAARLRADRTAQVSDLGADVPAQLYVTFDPEHAQAALSGRIFGQDRAIRAVTDRLSVTRASLDTRPERPDGVFLFAGPTGTGKTALAIELAREIYGTSNALIRLDMSEFAEAHTVSKLYGSPPGYVGSTDPDSWLTTSIRNRPQCVLLLDEIEKAHPQVWNAFLQVFDSGTLTDSQGNRAAFGEVVIVMTTNIGSQAFADKDSVGFLTAAANSHADEEFVHDELKRWMRPELLNRLDATIVFHPLGPDAIRSIARLHLDDVVRRLQERGWTLEVAEPVEDLLVARGFSREYGARPLLRTIEDLVVRPLARVPAGSYVLEVQDGQTRVRAIEPELVASHPLVERGRNKDVR